MTIYLLGPYRCLILRVCRPCSFTVKVPCVSPLHLPILTPSSPSLSTAVVHALSAAGMLNAHFTHFAQRFAYLQVNCCECSSCREKERRGRDSSKEQWVEGREKEKGLFFLTPSTPSIFISGMLQLLFLFDILSLLSVSWSRTHCSQM